MPPKSRYTIDDIVDAALSVVRRDGMDKLTARTVAAELGASTMPIYSCGKTMAEIEGAVVQKAWGILQAYQETPRRLDTYLDLGIGYVLFAREERHLYRCIHNDHYKEINVAMAEENMRRSLELLEDYPLLAGVPAITREKILIQGWIYSHGFADLLLNSMVRSMQRLETEMQIIDAFFDANQMFWDGLKTIVEKYRPS